MVAKTVYRGLDRVHASIAIQEYHISDITCMLRLILSILFTLASSIESRASSNSSPVESRRSESCASTCMYRP